VKTIKVAERLRTSGAVAANAAALLGLGIVNGPLYLVRPLLDSGAVELILTDYEPPTVPCHAVRPTTKVLPARTQLFHRIPGRASAQGAALSRFSRMMARRRPAVETTLRKRNLRHGSSLPSLADLQHRIDIVGGPRF
jgi:hypothetical protein